MRARSAVITGLVAAIAAANLVPNLGSSSLYVDEGLSWRAAAAPTVGGVVDVVRATEVSPPLHYLGLHEVLRRTSGSEIAMRTPSVVAGIALVVAILWLGTLTAGRRAGLVAAVLAALSPLVLEYGQQARAYVFAMLAATLAACALLKAERAELGSRGRRAWLVAFALTAIVGFWTHYTVALVCLPLLGSSVVRRGLRRGEAIAASAAVGAGWLLALPIMLDQVGKGRSEGLAHLAHLNVGNLVELLGTPFDTRYAFFDLTPSAALGAAAVAAAAVVAFARPAREWPLVRSLILPVVFFPIAAVLLVTVVGQDVLLTRYVAVAAPFMLVLIGAIHLMTGPRIASAILALAALSALTGSVLGHTRGGRYADWRAATREIAKADRPQDAVILNHPSIESTYTYYAGRAGLATLPLPSGRDPRLADLTRQGRQLWFTVVFPKSRSLEKAVLASMDYGAERTWTFDGSEPLRLILARPGRAAQSGSRHEPRSERASTAPAAGLPAG